MKRKYRQVSYQPELEYSRLRQWIVELQVTGILDADEAKQLRDRTDEWRKEAKIYDADED